MPIPIGGSRPQKGTPTTPIPNGRPPQKGQYAYYDSQLLNKITHWLVTTENGDCGCHYTLPKPLAHNEPFVTCTGRIQAVLWEVDNVPDEFSCFM